MSIFSWLFKRKRLDASDPGPSHFRLVGSKIPTMKVVGTSRHQQELKRLAGPKTEHGKQDRLRVLLNPDPDNPHDSRAVRVSFQAMTLGYLSKADAELYHRAIENAQPPGSTGNASADIVGGWINDTSEGHYGLRLMCRKPLEIKPHNL